ncbi:hypothetical protein C8R47DRAFT_1163798 [Mycena vitilis]|nr:hypothetical protein C8R47DRAFT_1163798 [Mycena vitilis]
MTWYPTNTYTGPDACTGKNHKDSDWFVAMNYNQFGDGSSCCGKQLRIDYNGKSAVAACVDERKHNWGGAGAIDERADPRELQRCDVESGGAGGAGGSGAVFLSPLDGFVSILFRAVSTGYLQAIRTHIHKLSPPIHAASYLHTIPSSISCLTCVLSAARP